MARTVYWVSPDGEMWKVQLEGAKTPDSRHRTKEEAIREARARAHANKPSQVKVQHKDGTIETEWTYGDDPFPPPG